MLDSRLELLNAKTSLRSISDMVFARECVVCGRELGVDENFACLGCLLDLPCTHFASIARNPMSKRLNALLSSLRPDDPAPYSYASALFYYYSSPHGALDYGNISKDLKYRRNFGSGRYFAHKLALELCKSPLYQDLSLIVPVPLHPSRRLKRGYNQAELIARELELTLREQGLGVRFSPLLVRSRRTATQTHLGVQAKFRNVQGVFALNNRLRSKLLGSKHILVVDDVFTTGATLSQCVVTLREALPDPSIRISVATLGYVGEL